MEKIKVIIADDHTIVRQGLSHILSFEDDIDVISEAANGQEAIEKVKAMKPDLVLMDLRMPQVTGVEAIREIRKFDTEVKFIILTTFDNEEDIFEGIRSGARGYLLKDATPDELVNAIHRVKNGESLINETMMTKLLNHISRQDQTTPQQQSTLTVREIEVLQYAAEGASNKDIAEKLFISVKTVKTHLTHIFDKLKARNRTEAVTKARKLGLLN